VVLFREVMVIQSDQTDRQEAGSNEDVEPVESRRHIEGRSIHRIRDREVRIHVLEGLQPGKGHGQGYGHPQGLDPLFSVPGHNRVMGPGHRGSGGQQNQGVQERHLPGVQDLNSSGRPHRPNFWGWGQGGPEERPEEGKEEPDFGDDEQDHPKPSSQLNQGRVLTFPGSFSDNVSPPYVHGGSPQA